MIGIRSITYHMPQVYNSDLLDRIARVSRFWASTDLFVRTQRVAFVPLMEAKDIKDFAPVSQLCDMSDVRWFNIPIDPWNATNRPALFKFAEEAISTYGRAFVNVLTFQNGQMEYDITRKSCDLIKKVSNISHNGKDNFRLGLSVNVKPNGSFFPFTYSGGQLGFSIALELTQEINAICAANPTLPIAELRNEIKKAIDVQLVNIQKTVNEFEKTYNLTFLGYDFSIAPIISMDGSVIPIIQRLGIYNYGRTGTLFATAYLTDLLKSFSNQYTTVGFSGVMYSLLEDLELCTINNQRGVCLDDLIKVSTMCGCGVDMVPVPYDISCNELETIALEIYAISTRLNKPLGIRILPIPHTKKSQMAYTNLSDDADFIANTKVVDLDVNILRNIDSSFSFYNTGLNKKE